MTVFFSLCRCGALMVDTIVLLDLLVSPGVWGKGLRGQDCFNGVLELGVPGVVLGVLEFGVAGLVTDEPVLVVMFRVGVLGGCWFV